MNKKRYAGLYWTNPETWDRMDTKGIETVRRDNAPICGLVIDKCLNFILVDRSIQKATEYVQSVVSDLLQNKVDMALLVISKSLAKEEYKAKTAHDELAKRMRKRDPGTAPALGDRVPYVITRGLKGSKVYENAEDPLYVLEHDIAIDPMHYIDHGLRPPLARLFENVVKDADKQFFAGAHTRKVVNRVATGGAGALGMAKFITKSIQCLGCKGMIKEGAFCPSCKKDKEPQVVMQKLANLRLQEQEYAKLWTQCQRCQSSVHQEVLCTSRDCPIFYRRVKAKKEIAYATAEFQRLDLSW